MKPIRSLVLLLSIAVMISAFAASPDLKEWDRSPQGCFMTKAEHDEWNTLKTPEEQQHFVDQFLAKRGPAFVAEVATRAAKADQYLTIGKLPGSKTLRGKVVILFGPPTSMDINPVVDNGSVHHDNPSVASAYSGGTGGGTASGRSTGDVDMNEGSRTMGSGSLNQNYHLNYVKTPVGPLDVMITADGYTGKDRPATRDDVKKLDTAFEAAAQASIKTK
jgi:GWxTD domain-containing protein